MSSQQTLNVHFGPGYFSMGHWATYVQDMNDRGAHYNMVGVSLCSTGMRDKMAAQDNRYTVTEVGAGEPRVRPITAMSEVLAASDPKDHARVETLLKQGDAAIFSMTVTQGGYSFKNGGLLLGHPELEACLSAKETAGIKTTIGFVAEGLFQQYSQGREPAVVLSLDNMPQNGDLVRLATLGYIEEAQRRGNRFDKGYGDWVEQAVRFPNTMVDRIVPAHDPRHQAYLQESHNITDRVAVKTEGFRQLVVETDGHDLPPALANFADVGVQLVDNVAPYETTKVRVLNGAHLFLGPVGYLALGEDGVAPDDRTVFNAMQMREVATATEAFLRNTARTLNVPPLVLGDKRDAGVEDYVQITTTRFNNPRMSDGLSRLPRNAVTQKLEERNVKPMNELLANGQPATAHAFGLAAWMVYARGRDLNGQAFDTLDPKAAELGIPQLADKVARGEESSRAVFRELNRCRLLGDGGPLLEANVDVVNAIDGMAQGIATNGIKATARRLNFNQ